MTDKLKGLFHGCPHHGDDYESCIQHSGTAPCGVEEERDDIEERYHMLASEMVYEGNSVQHWRHKAMAYKGCASSISALKQALDIPMEEGAPADVVRAVYALIDERDVARHDYDVIYRLYLDEFDRGVEQAARIGEARPMVEAHLRHVEKTDFVPECRNAAGMAQAWLDKTADSESPSRHGDNSDDIAVDKFSAAMKTKLAEARGKGRGGWDDPDLCSPEFLADLLLGHIGKGNKGNLEDIGNLAMMLHQRGENPVVLAEAFDRLKAQWQAEGAEAVRARLLEKANVSRAAGNPAESAFYRRCANVAGHRADDLRGQPQEPAP